MTEGKELRPSEGLNGKRPTLITRMARLLVAKAKQIERCCYATLDAYHAVGPSFLILKEAVNKKGEQLVHLITKAKRNTVAYIEVENGKQFQQENIKLMKLFDQPDLFTQAEANISGKTKTISYLCINLLWKPIEDMLRFVLILDGDERYILMCSDLNLSPTDVIVIYNYRSKIEVMFSALKHVLGGFCYHFWSKFHPKLQGKKLDVKSMSEKLQQKLEQKLTASDYPSEQVVQNVIKSEYFNTDDKVPRCRTLQIIHERKNSESSPLLL